MKIGGRKNSTICKQDTAVLPVLLSVPDLAASSTHRNRELQPPAKPEMVSHSIANANKPTRGIFHVLPSQSVALSGDRAISWTHGNTGTLIPRSSSCSSARFHATFSHANANLGSRCTAVFVCTICKIAGNAMPSMRVPDNKEPYVKTPDVSAAYSLKLDLSFSRLSVINWFHMRIRFCSNGSAIVVRLMTSSTLSPVYGTKQKYGATAARAPAPPNPPHARLKYVLPTRSSGGVFYWFRL